MFGSQNEKRGREKEKRRRNGGKGRKREEGILDTGSCYEEDKVDKCHRTGD